MSLTEDYERVKAGRLINDWKGTVISIIAEANKDIDNHLAEQYGFIADKINHCVKIGQKFLTLKQQFPDDEVEIDALLQQGITALNNLKTRYETEV